VKQGAHLLPEGFLRSNLFENGLKQCTTELLRLVDQERQHRHFHKDHAQILFAEAVVMLEMVPLVFQGVEGFILDFPASAAGSHDPVDTLLGQRDVGDP